MVQGTRTTLEQVVTELLEMEKRKHLTHVGFVVLAIYKDHKPVAKVNVRPEFDAALCEAVGDLSAMYYDNRYANQF